MSRGKIIAGVVALIVVGGIVAGVVVSAQNAVPLVTVSKVTEETLSVTITASGKIEAAANASVFPPTAGILDTVDVKDGQQVKAGDTLAVLDTAPLELQVAQARTGVKSAKAQLETVKNSKAGTYDKAAAAAAVRAAQFGYNSAKSAYDGWVLTHPSPSGEPTSTQLKLGMLNAETGLRSAQAANAKAQFCLNAAIAAANAGIDQAEEALALAQDTLAKATLTAPVDGVVVFEALGAPGMDGTLPKASHGAAVAPQSAVFTIVQLGGLNFNAQVDEADIARVKPDMGATVRLDAFPAESIDGKVTSIRTTAIQTTTGGIAFPVLVSINAGSKSLLLGMSGSVDIKVSDVPTAITVPIEALFDENGKKYVFVVAAGKVSKVEVTTGALTDTRAQIASGVTAGQEIAVGNLSSLSDGLAVRTK